MGQMWTITRRETVSLFYSPIAYVAMAVFLFFMALIFAAAVFHPSEPSDLRRVFGFSRFILTIVTPLVTMSLLSEEFKSGRIEMLRTNPISPSALVFGKFFGGFAFYLAIVGSLLVFVLMLAIFGGPDYHMLVANFIGLGLMGLLYVSVGLFFSACTESQLLAAIGTFLVLFAVNMADWVLDLLGGSLTGTPTIKVADWIKTAVTQSTIAVHFEDFTKGIIDVSHCVYFLTTAGFFVFLTYLVLESRNWRR